MRDWQKVKEKYSSAPKKNFHFPATQQDEKSPLKTLPDSQQQVDILQKLKVDLLAKEKLDN